MLSVGLLLFAVFCKAQVEFAPLGATWHFDYYYFVSVFGYDKIISAADTVVLGKLSKKLELKRVWKDVGLSGSSGIEHETHFLHQSGDTIFHLNPNYPFYMDDFVVLFNFSLAAGDTLFYDEEWYYVVDSTGTMEFNGEPYKVQFGRTTHDWSSGDTLTIISEKFGPLKLSLSRYTGFLLFGRPLL